MEELIGHTINNFELQEVIGEGSMGIVYRAYHPDLQRYAAVKLLRPERMNHVDAYERFLQEARTAARLQHTNIVNVLNFGQHDELYYLMMEYIEGPSLRDLINENPDGIPVPQVAQIFAQIASVLITAHEKGILHRDLKPDNILLTDSQDENRPYQAMVTDFGLVKIADGGITSTKDGTTLGTPAYMSPEQCAGQSLDVRTDLYALGVMLYECLTGQRPYPIRNLFDAVRFHGSGNFVPPRAHVPTIPLQLNILVRRLMAAEIEKRPEDAAEVFEKLHRFLPKEDDANNEDTSRIVNRIRNEIHLAPEQKMQNTGPLPNISRDTVKDPDQEDAPTTSPYCVVALLNGRILYVSSPLIQGKSLTVGRQSECDIILNSPERYVSKQHCTITFDDDTVYIEDLNSTNGTFLGDERLEPGQRIVWDGEKDINLGAHKLSLQDQSRPMRHTTEGDNITDTTRIHGRHLLVCTGATPEKLPFGEVPVTVGRIPGCELVINNSRISKRHCQLQRHPDGRITITDLGSTNGTYLQGRRLPANQPIAWDGKEAIQIGEYTIEMSTIG